MLRLALAVGFLSVFGIVAVAVVSLLKDYFKHKKEENNNQNNNNNQNKKEDEQTSKVN